MKPLCPFCREEVPKGHGALRAVTGWEEVRKGGGANKIVGRRETGEWAHSWCVQFKQKGEEIQGQERMFE